MCLQLQERKPTELLIERTLPSGKQLVYKLVDNPTRLRPREWEQVVCVVVQGAAWQFKGWVYDQPVKLFDYALGVHFKYDDTALDKRVSDWNVKVLEINKYKRYQDTNSSLEFWRLLDSFMMVNKTNILGGR
jgi:parafibromin